MSREDNISKIFLDNEYKLDEKPPEMLWDRLEEKLRDRSTGQRKTIYRQILAIAAMLLVIATAMLFTFTNQGDQNGPMASFEEQAEPTIAFGDKEDSKPPRPILMSHKEKVHYKKMDLIAENQQTTTTSDEIASNGLTPKSENKAPSNTITNRLDENEVGNATNAGKIIAMKEDRREPVFEPSPAPPKQIAPVTSTETVSKPAPAPIVSTSSSKVMEMNTAGVVEDILEEEALAVETIPRDELPVAEDLKDKRAPSAPSPGYADVSIVTEREKALQKTERSNLPWEKEERDSKKRKKAKSAEMLAQEAKSTAAPAIAEKGDYASRSDFDDGYQSVDLFSWILGDWKDQSGSSVERWTKVNGKKISGKGYLLENGKPVFSEDMLIEQINGQLYFIATLELGKEPVYLKLDNYDNNRAVFVNEDNNSFPKTVVINRLSANSFEITINASGINTVQESFLSNRNFVLPTNATRNLIRSNE